MRHHDIQREGAGEVVLGDRWAKIEPSRARGGIVNFKKLLKKPGYSHVKIRGVYTSKKTPQYSGVLRYTIAEYEGVNRLFHI